MNNEIKRLIYKYINGTLADDEAVRLAEWARLTPQNAAEFRREICRMERQVRVSEEARAFADRLVRSRKMPKRRSVFGSLAGFTRRYARTIAAVIVVGVAMGVAIGLVPDRRILPFVDNGIVAQSQQDEQTVAEPVVYFTGHNERRTVVLPDGTVVTLNADARLTLAADFGGKERRVMLDGEGWFEVAKDKAHRFVVVCGDKEYIVRGTSFNIVSYASDRYSVVTLHTGRLEARIKEDVIQLNPGDELRVDDSLGQITKQAVAVENSISWINNGQLRFSESPLKFVASRLSHKYNIKVHIHSSVENIPYDGQIDNESLTEALRLVALTAPVPLVVTEFDGEYYVSKRANQ